MIPSPWEAILQRTPKKETLQLLNIQEKNELH
jgi:hypothetical protein